MNTQTHDLAHGWYANLTTFVDGSQTLIIRNPDRGQRIDLGADAVATLRAIFATADKPSK